jgi:hydrogenase maturation protease
VKTLVVGIGSTILSDDGVGVRVVERLSERALPAQVEVVQLGTAGLGLLDLVEDCQRLILVDAIVTGAVPGTLHELRGDDVARAAHLGPGHEADLPTTLAFGQRVLGRKLPHQVVVIAVEAEDLTTFSESLTPRVHAAVEPAVARIEALLHG